MKIIDGTGAVLGRLAAIVAKELLKGEEIAIVNCNDVVITGNKLFLIEEFKVQRGRGGMSQKGPRHPKDVESMVKRTIRGMLPNHKWGRGRVALKKVKCYAGVPTEFEKSEKITLKTDKIKTNKLSEFLQ